VVPPVISARFPCSKPMAGQSKCPGILADWPDG
jgi:hypothetical protein